MKATFLLMSSAFLTLCFACIPDPLLFLPTHPQRGHLYSYFIAANPEGPIIASQSWQRDLKTTILATYKCYFTITGSLHLHSYATAQKLWFLLKEDDLKKVTDSHM